MRAEIINVFFALAIALATAKPSIQNAHNETALNNEKNPCISKSCGPNSMCLAENSTAICSCLPGYRGAPPSCKPECNDNSECSNNLSCINNQCQDPCFGVCGVNAHCRVMNHNPICECLPGRIGNPFIGCKRIEMDENNLCSPSPCGPNSICRVVNDKVICTSQSGYIGAPPETKCTVHSECAKNMSCIDGKCKDPCSTTCSPTNTQCEVVNHSPICTCLPGMIGNPSLYCKPIVERKACTGDSDCSTNEACFDQFCEETCSITCGINAICRIFDDILMCICSDGKVGGPTMNCDKPRVQYSQKGPCDPSPCGLNSICRIENDEAVCSCKPGYLGAPPSCKPECTSHSECSDNLSCINNHCREPCVGVCGVNAKCAVVDRESLCTCLPGKFGDPYEACRSIEGEDDACSPSPCGPNSICQTINRAPACSCQSGFIGFPPNCRPECTVNSECANNLSCIRGKCLDPCAGSCGFRAECKAIDHVPVCSCPPGEDGDPFIACRIAEGAKKNSTSSAQ